MLSELENINEKNISQVSDNGEEFAVGLWAQIKLITIRMTKLIYRNPEYVNNKFALHIITGLFSGFTFWQIGNSVSDLNLRMFATFQFVFIAPGVINQLQPLFIERRDIYDAREKKSRMYTGIGQFIAAYAPNATVAVLANPIFIFTTVGYYGVFVPYE
ncbi:uncharacterized protein A1O9_01867 [Exophiala aquamarina CBS 119918]|uniref:ABC-2 type transporter transmembrane domain-containing protein n=1 Tax=Exophiala aquamarina CBS 119918 TaxID=1182545 RepID=A0A072PKR0_9EURO|nr:uncharacterized protein A1O9_01867 [Exophiala aquamarina CBS 119918]KEF60307.1 hypothetical protein A1O9_01867 [Exophiala aquamarina CBS 119918]